MHGRAQKYKIKGTLSIHSLSRSLFFYSTLSGVVANVVIANAFLGEPLRIRDVMGGAFVIIGVGFIGGFSPYNPEPLTGERLHELVAWPGAITIYCVYGLMMLGMLYVVRKY